MTFSLHSFATSFQLSCLVGNLSRRGWEKQELSKLKKGKAGMMKVRCTEQESIQIVDGHLRPLWSMNRRRRKVTQKTASWPTHNKGWEGCSDRSFLFPTPVPLPLKVLLPNHRWPEFSSATWVAPNQPLCHQNHSELSFICSRIHLPHCSMNTSCGTVSFWAKWTTKCSDDWVYDLGCS